MELKVEESNLEYDRIDRFLAIKLPDLSRSRLQSLIKEGHIKLNGKKTKPSQPIGSGDIIKVIIPPLQEALAQPEEIDLEVLFEDEHLIVVNKPHGLVVHPAAGNPSGTLVNALLHHCKELSGIGGVERPGIVHRLDKDTSGCLVAAKSDASHKKLVEYFSERQINKIYLAVVDGIPALDSGRIENNIARDPRDRQKMAVVQPPRGKVAITEYENKIHNEVVPSTHATPSSLELNELLNKMATEVYLIRGCLGPAQPKPPPSLPVRVPYNPCAPTNSKINSKPN